MVGTSEDGQNGVVYDHPDQNVVLWHAGWGTSLRGFWLTYTEMKEIIYIHASNSYIPNYAHGPQDIAHVHNSASMRILARLGNNERATQWIIPQIEGWLALIPHDEYVLVRTVGWKALWELGYPKSSRPTFVKISRAELIDACRRDPEGSAWWLEVSPAATEGDTRPKWYFVFYEHADGWSPLLIGDPSWLYENLCRIIAMYEESTVTIQILTEHSLDEFIAGATVWPG